MAENIATVENSELIKVLKELKVDGAEVSLQIIFCPFCGQPGPRVYTGASKDPKREYYSTCEVAEVLCRECLDKDSGYTRDKENKHIRLIGGAKLRNDIELMKKEETRLRETIKEKDARVEKAETELRHMAEIAEQNEKEAKHFKELYGKLKNGE